MALIHCPECQHEVSTLTASCPNCGYLLQPQRLSLQDDPDLVRLVERERRRREWAPVSIAVAVIVLIFGLITFASSMARQPSQTQYHTCTQSVNWPPSPDATWTSGSFSVSEVGDGTPCP